MTSAPKADAVTRLEDALWARLPAALWRRVPTLGLISTDGGWTRAQRGAGLIMPAAALLLGLARGAWRPDDQVTYSYSTVWLCLMLALALAGTGIGTWLWLGFVAGDLIGHEHVRPYASLSPLEILTGVAVPLLLSYLLLALLRIGTPLIALLVRGGISGVLHQVDVATRDLIAIGCAALTTAINVGLWTQSFPLLIRPIWVWNPTYGSPDMTGIAPVQTHPWIFAFIAGAGTLGWGLLAERAIRARIVGRRYQPIATASGAEAATTTSVLAVLIRSALILLLLGGLVPSYLDAGIAFAILVAGFIAQTLLLPRTAAARWWTARAPAIVRIGVAALVAWLVAWQIGRTAYQSVLGTSFITTQSFAPLLYASVAAIAVIAVMLPAGQRTVPR